MITLRDYQADALSKLHNGSILNGGVGSGKSRTSLAYYYTQYGGKCYYYKKNQATREYDIGPYDCNTGMLARNPYYKKMVNPPDLYIITTAKKRDDMEWEEEMLPFLFGLYNIKITIDSWQNIRKYENVKDAFFIFDEQKVSGGGVWAKTFIKIARDNNNRWILLSATPGDNWEQYRTVFIANGFFKNKTDFERKHAVYSTYVKTYPKIDHYVNTGALIRMRQSLLVMMDFDRTEIIRHHDHVICNYDTELYFKVEKDHWDVYNNKPIDNPTVFCYTLRRILYSDPDRINQLMFILRVHPRAIIFYNFDYELELIRAALSNAGYTYAEWNGHNHQEVPKGPKWAYLVQYAAGAEAWNCITTDTMVFYSQNYSYKVMEQASGRIDRMNTPFDNLWYYHLRSDARIDNEVRKALRRKQKFNEESYAPVFKKMQEEKRRAEAVGQQAFDLFAKT